MSGNAGIRGYLIQTIICVLDALEKDNNWVSVTLEPMDESEKVDIRWRYSNDITKVCQVKSSQNIIRKSAAKKWCQELESNSPDAKEYELILVGTPEESLLQTSKIGNTDIPAPKPLDTQILIDVASNKIDSYYERKGKNKISSKVREILVKSLTAHFGNNSIVGKEIERNEFDTLLKDWISSIEAQIEANPFASLAPPMANEKVEFNHRIAKKILELIGWNQFGENYTTEVVDEETAEVFNPVLNFAGDLESKLKEKTGDFIMVSSVSTLTYPKTSKQEILKFIHDTEIIFNDFKIKKTIPLKKYEVTDYYNILFWLTTDNNEVTSDFIHHVKDNFKRDLLNEEINYFILDNNKANFLISSIATAKNYRQDIPVKFLYPITESNQSPDKIGQRGLKLPVQYINSSIIPIAKEDKSKISFLLFCSDPFSTDSLKKLIWLTIKLTSGFGNEYILYFPDYNETLHKNEATKVIRSFNEDLLDEKIQLKSYDRIDAAALDSITSTTVNYSKNEVYEEKDEQSLINSKHLNEAFINILPYGDILKPFLNTEAITANDLKIFLANKGIIIKNADKVKLIDLMSTLLMSPKELEDFKSLIDIKDRTIHTTNEIYNIKNNDSLENIVKKINPNFDVIGDGFKTKILNENLKLEKHPTNKDEFIISSDTETKDPTSQISVNTVWGKFEAIFRKEDDKIVVSQINSVSREDKLIANRAVKAVLDELKRVDFVKEETVSVMFKNFGSNSDRVNFLLSFINTESSAILHSADIQSIKFKFDDNTEIPETYKDKADKDLVINFEGKALGSLNELVDQKSKEAVFLEEMRILYKFNHANIKNGLYKVTYNFSNALKNKFETNGNFKTEPYLIMSNNVKNLGNVDALKKILSKEIEKLKINKLKQFNIIE
jgi:hypothetical protein